MEPKKIKRIIEDISGVDLVVKNRKSENIMWRKAYFRLCSEYTSHTLKSIGSAIGRKHSTAVHHSKNFDFLERNYPEIKKKYYQVVMEVERQADGARWENSAQRILNQMKMLTNG